MKITLDGMNELRNALQKLPADLASDASQIIDNRTRSAASSIRAAYHKGKTGNLKNRVTVAVTKSGVSVTGIVRSNAPHAALYEFGTGSLNVAHPSSDRRTDKGANRGSSPPHPTVIPIAQAERRGMTRELIDLVKRAGFEVTGG